MSNALPKSDVVKRVEEMAAQREERRRSVEAFKEERAAYAAAAEAFGGIDAVEFLQRIEKYRRLNGLAGAPVAWSSERAQNEHIWSPSHGSSAIRVCVRKRPMLHIEQAALSYDVVSAETGHFGLTVHEPKTKVDLSKDVQHHRFAFDACFNEADDNMQIYAACLQPIVVGHVLEGGEATVFAFGQTGSGKTCTMAGHGDRSSRDGNALGLYALAAEDIMRLAGERGLSVGISFFEVYRGLVLDLLGGCARLDTMEDETGHVNIVGLREVKVESVVHLLDIVGSASNIRATGSNSINQQSSRSHAILQVILREPIPNVWPIVGRLCLVDLAGSERASESGTNDEQTKQEGAEINKSLLCLKECIRSLDSGKDHVPFRGSKLTQVLKESFVGNSKTVMIATVSPGSSAAEDTLNTLRYAQRVREFSSKRSPVKGGGGASGAQPLKANSVPPSQAPPHTRGERTAPGSSRRATASSASSAAPAASPSAASARADSGRRRSSGVSAARAASPSQPSSARRSGSPQSSSRTAAARKGGDRPLGKGSHHAKQLSPKLSAQQQQSPPSLLTPSHAGGAPPILTSPPSPISLPFEITDAGAPATLDGMDAAAATWEAITEAEGFLGELLATLESDAPGAGMCGDETRMQIMALINTVDSIDEMREGLPTGTASERALYERLVEADALHDEGYDCKEDFVRVTNGVVQAKREVYSALRRHLEVLKEELSQAPAADVGGDREHALASAENAPSSSTTGWWPWRS